MEKKLRKGPWSKQEDAILIKYVERYGPKKWNLLQRVTGLPREGKSCRLRWLNHLNPYLKKGKLSEEEKQKIIQLRQLGINWCEIVKQTPGRTDNEIKNFYHINKRKKLKLENSNGECQKKKKKINVASTSTKNNVASTSTKNNSSPTIIDRIQDVHWMNELNNNGESSNQQQGISDTHEMEIMKDSFHIPIMQPSNMLCNNVPSTSTINNSPPTIIDRGEAPFMPTNMVSNVPLFIEYQTFESPHHPHTSTSDKPSLTFIDRSETSFISKDMESNLPLLPESMNFESFESLIQKYPPLPLRSSEEIQREQLELDSPFNNNLMESMFNTSNILDDSNGNLYFCETRLVDENGNEPTYLKKDESNCETRLIDENGMKPTYLKKDESNNEDLIDLLDSLGWFDGYIF
ncbi:transcription factor MYB87-like [Trifolium pratense]|uniref:transcription factor MYB87-like n=1 Tax=Trifolium pratense TaxID=57577 RepID=UPI001E695F62|nr:transcription factor MYB87-like [Trifolium pratense]